MFRGEGAKRNGVERDGSRELSCRSGARVQRSEQRNEEDAASRLIGQLTTSDE